MKTRIALLTLLLGGSCPAGDFDPFVGPKPVAVLLQTDPWAAVIASDTPRFALYEDRSVVFLKETGGKFALHRAVLGEEAFDQLRARLKQVAQHPDLKPRYDLAQGITDQPEARFYLRSGDGHITCTVYGLRAVEKSRRIEGIEPADRPTDGNLDPPPKELFDLHEFLVDFDLPDSREWEPAYLEVMLWPFEHAPGEPVLWPAGWPDLDSGRAFPRGNSWSVFLDGKLADEAKKFLAQRQRSAVSLAGGKWSLAMRPAFPGEPVWRAAFSKALEEADGQGR